MNKEYLLEKIKPYLNSNKDISQEDFERLFSNTNKDFQSKVVKILKEDGINIDYNSKRKTTSNKNNIRKSDLEKLNISSIPNEQLVIYYQSGNKVAMDILIKKNEKFIWSRVKKYSKILNHKLDEEDLFQAGCIGLIQAVSKYEFSKDAKLSTYALYWIDQKILRTIMDEGFTIRIPVHQYEKVSKITALYRDNLNKSTNEICELAEKIYGYSKKQFYELDNLMKQILSLTSLNILIGEDKENERGDFIWDYQENVEEIVEKKILKEDIIKAIDALSERERYVLEERFGICNGCNKTLEEIGQTLGVTRERVRQIEAKALEKLRKKNYIKYLKGEV